MHKNSTILDDKAINRAITRISNEIIERNKGVKNVVLVGIKTRGVPLAKRIASKILELEKIDPPVYILDINFYRDDLIMNQLNPVIKSEFIGDIQNKTVVLVDDVIFTGRTVRAALDAISDKGRAERIQLAVLIDRGHRELPIRADYVGKNVPTAKSEMIRVMLNETDNIDEVVISKL